MKEKQPSVRSGEKEKVSLCILILGGVGKGNDIAAQGYLWSLTLTQITSRVQIGMSQEKQLHQQTCVDGVERGRDVRGQQLPCRVIRNQVSCD